MYCVFVFADKWRGSSMRGPVVLADGAKSKLGSALSSKRNNTLRLIWLRGVASLVSTRRRVSSWSPPQDVHLEYVDGADRDTFIILMFAEGRNLGHSS